MARISRFFISMALGGFLFIQDSTAQVNTVEYGHNRVQYKKFKWKYYQTENFNTYFSQNGQEIAKYVMQVAEEELKGIESFVEYSLQQRANIVVYNSFADMDQTNIGLGSTNITSDGATKLVNNKMLVYFDGDHEHLKKQIREGIARILTENLIFGDDLGEVASNQALLDLPTWMTEGYISFVGENWSTQLDDELKNEILSGDYRNFYDFEFSNPQLAGHAFWHYIAEKYKKENVTYLFYLIRVHKNINKASQIICKKKLKAVLADFMEYEDEKYSNDINRRKAYPKGSTVESFDVTKNHDYYRINVNPAKKNNGYVFTEYKKGIIQLKINDDDNFTTLLKYGIRMKKNESNPGYPLVAWDPKGKEIAVVYMHEGHLKLFVYDVERKLKFPKLDLTKDFDQIQDVKYMLDNNTLLFSAVKNGHTDIFTYDLKKEKYKQITNDIYDDLDPTFVSFPQKTGILFSSNRPFPGAVNTDSVLPSRNRYNVFLISNFEDKAGLSQITKLTDLKYGNARFPMPYNENHFTFISDENGIGNRYAGFFTTKAAGQDTVIQIGDELIRNPSQKEVDSTLRAMKRKDIDTFYVVKITEDSVYSFPLSNYPSTVSETRSAGDNRQVSEVTRESHDKTLYKLKIDENTLRKRNIANRPTTYMND